MFNFESQNSLFFWRFFVTFTQLALLKCEMKNQRKKKEIEMEFCLSSFECVVRYSLQKYSTFVGGRKIGANHKTKLKELQCLQ